MPELRACGSDSGVEDIGGGTTDDRDGDRLADDDDAPYDGDLYKLSWAYGMRPQSAACWYDAPAAAAQLGFAFGIVIW